MAYQIHKRILKNGTETFQIVYKRSVNGIEERRFIPKAEWKAIGFYKEMSISDAREFAKHLNSNEHLRVREEKRTRIQARLQNERLIVSAHLPSNLVLEFETSILARRLNRGLVPSKRHLIHWRAAQRIIREINLEPSAWADSPEIIYGYLERNKVSLDYSTKLLRILNLWGHFYCRKTSKAFLPILNPRGYNANRIVDSYQEKIPGGMASSPITPKELEKAKSQGLREDHYNWIYIAIWLGLRPSEVDALNIKTSHKLWTDTNGIKVLSIYQSKLKQLHKDKRWKHIPLLETEQLTAIELIEKGEFKRPLVKTIKSFVNTEATTYGPRKGFVTLMHKERGHDLAHVSSWLGHQSIDRTFKSYTDKDEVLYRKAS